MQMQLGLWLTTLQSAFSPHVPGQGSLHFWLIQAKWLEHSLLLTHSGLQLGGWPINWGKQEQDGDPLISLHWALGPQGDGLHGSTNIGSFTEIFTDYLNCSTKFALVAAYELFDFYLNSFVEQIILCQTVRLQNRCFR